MDWTRAPGLVIAGIWVIHYCVKRGRSEVLFVEIMWCI